MVGGYTCHLCQRSRLEGPQAVRFHVQEPLHQINVEQLQRDRRQASMLLQRWNLIHSPNNTTTSRQGDSSTAAAASVEEQQTSSLRGANRFHPNFNNNFNRPSNMGFGATPQARRSGPTSGTATIGMEESSLLLTRIDRLGLPAWRDAVQACLFRYLSLQGEADTNNLQQAHVILNKYEHWEGIALLELAVWKAICLVEMPPEACGDYYAAKAWLDSGWKILKPAQRQSNAVDIVLSRVVPFLACSSTPNDLEQESTTTTTPASAASFVPGETARPRRRLAHQRRLRFHNQLPAALYRVNNNNNNSAVDYLRGASRRLLRAPGQWPDYMPHNDDDDAAAVGGEDDYDFDGIPAWAQDM